MEKMALNVSILIILTTETERIPKESAEEQGDDKKQILFLHLKPVAAFTKIPRPLWYNGLGGGKAKYRWKAQRLRQWMAAGRDEDIANLYQEILNGNVVSIAGQNIRFRMPAFQIQELKSDFYLPRVSSNSTALIAKHPLSVINNFMLIEDNLLQLCGEKPSAQGIVPFYPPGMYKAVQLLDYFSNHIIGIIQERIPYLSLSGTPEVSGEEAENILGFWQKPNGDKEAYVFSIEDQIGNVIVSQTQSEDERLIKLTYSKSVANPIFKVSKGQDILQKMTIHWIKNLVFNPKIVHTIVTDIYDNKHYLTEDAAIKPTFMEPFTWHLESYASKSHAIQQLSEKFTQIFTYLSPHILIIDPYFFNTVTSEQLDGNQELHASQAAFINAIALACLKTGIDDLTFLGHEPTVGNNAMMERVHISNAKKLFTAVFNNVSYVFPTVSFKDARTSFHNRYWCSLRSSENGQQIDKCFIVTTSLAIMNEVDILEVVHRPQLEAITRKYNRIFQDSIALY